ncbi:MAG: hypothetical protein OEY11_01575 [Gammaproteobacteria bacterium]|nr:hypothetical protein [Gammaproteobacteria bacterium]
MKIIVNIVLLVIIAAAGYYVYQQNMDELNATLDNVKSMSVDSMTDVVMEKVKTISSDELIDLALDNKEELLELMRQQDISVENLDMQQLKAKLEESGVKLDEIDLNEPAYQDKLKEMLNSLKQ